MIHNILLLCVKNNYAKSLYYIKKGFINTLYVSDLDGIILNRNSQLSEKSKEIINTLVKKGVKFTYATTRSFSFVSKILDGLQFVYSLLNGKEQVSWIEGKENERMLYYLK